MSESPKPSVLEIAELQTLFAGEPVAFAQFLGDVAQAIDECAAAIVAAAEADDLARVRAKAHELKGVAGNVGALELAACSRAVEDAAKAGASDGISEALSSFFLALDRFRVALEAVARPA